MNPKEPVWHFLKQVAAKLGFTRTMTAPGSDVVDAVNRQSDQKANQGTLAKVENGTTASETIPADSLYYHNGELYYTDTQIAQGATIPSSNPVKGLKLINDRLKKTPFEITAKQNFSVKYNNSYIQNGYLFLDFRIDGTFTGNVWTVCASYSTNTGNKFFTGIPRGTALIGRVEFNNLEIQFQNNNTNNAVGFTCQGFTKI